MKIILALALMLGGGCAGSYPFQKTAYYSDKQSCYQMIFYDNWIEEPISISVDGNKAYVLFKHWYPNRVFYRVGFDLKTYRIRKKKEIVFELKYDEYSKPTISYDAWIKADYP